MPKINQLPQDLIANPDDMLLIENVADLTTHQIKFKNLLTTNVGVDALKTDAVTGAKIDDLQISSAKIRDGAVGYAKQIYTDRPQMTLYFGSGYGQVYNNEQSQQNYDTAETVGDWTETFQFVKLSYSGRVKILQDGYYRIDLVWMLSDISSNSTWSINSVIGASAINYFTPWIADRVYVVGRGGIAFTQGWFPANTEFFSQMYTPNLTRYGGDKSQSSLRVTRLG